MNERKNMGNKGFTLVEVMLSIAILALISVPLMKYFSDSLRYAAQTAEKQKATMIAQETVEYIKSQKKIVKWDDVTTMPTPVATDEPDPDAEPTPEPTPVSPITVKTYFLAPELQTLFGGYAGAPTPEVEIPGLFSETGATLGTSGSPEPMVYRYIDQRSGKYLVEVAMNCTVPMSEVDSPAIMQIDDTRNVVIAERSEVMDAITHFSTLNLNTYMSWHGGFLEDPSLTPEPTPDEFVYITPEPDPDDPIGVIEYRELSEAEIRANMDRIIYITISKGVTDTQYTISAYYQFFCKDVFGPGTDSDMEYPSSTLCEASVETLEGIFLMFNKMSDTNDYVQIQWNVADDTPYPDFRFVVQDDIEISDDSDDGGDDDGGDDDGDGDGDGDDDADSDDGDSEPEGDGDADDGSDDDEDDGSEDPSDGYKLTIDLLGFTSSESKPTVHSNLGGSSFVFSDITSEVTKPGSAGQIAAGAAQRTDIPVLTLTGDGVPVRLFDITVKVYKNEKAYEDDPTNPLVELKTTKVE